MADYRPLLSRLIGTLSPNTREARRDLYDRARGVLLNKLRTDPKISDAELREEISALEAAIVRVEADAVSQSAPSLDIQGEPYASKAQGYQDKPPLTDGRKSWRAVVFVFGALAVTLVGIGSYFLGPQLVSNTRGALGQRSVSSIAEQPVTNTAYIYLRQPVYYRTNHPVGTIIVDKAQGFLYMVKPNFSALRYGIGVGAECTTSVGLYQVVRKEEWPGWKPPVGQTNVSDDDRMKNPLGARALYLNKDYRIHGSNAALTRNQPTPQGCIRLVNDDIIYLYDRTPLESRVVVLN